MVSLNPPVSQSLRQTVGQQLHRMIIAGELRPGQRVIQQRLAEKLSVSQSVVREALLEMQFTGLVESVDNLGVFVTSLNRTMVVQAYEVREMLEGLAARRCCQTTSLSDIRELNDLAQRVYELGLSHRDRERAELDRRLHDRIFELAQNDVLRRLAGAYHIVRLVVLRDFPHQQVRDDHLNIVDAIGRNDPASAEHAARQHVVRARQMIEQQISRDGFELPIGAQA